MDFSKDYDSKHYSLIMNCDVLVDILISDPSFCLRILRAKHQIVQYFHRKSTFIRMLWKKDFDGESDYKVFVELLRYNIIPEDQLTKAYDHMLEHISPQIFDEENEWWFGEEVLLMKMIG